MIKSVLGQKKDTLFLSEIEEADRNTLNPTRTVYLIGLSRFLQTVPVTFAGNCHVVASLMQLRSNVQSNYGGYTSKHIQ